MYLFFIAIEARGGVQIIYNVKYMRFTLRTLSLAIIVTSVAFCASLSSAEKSEELYDALNALLFAEDSGFIINSSDMGFCMEIAQKVFENQKMKVVAGCPHISPSNDMVFIPFHVTHAKAIQHRYIVMHKHTANSLIWAHNHSEESFLGLMKGLYDISFYFIPAGP